MEEIIVKDANYLTHIIFNRTEYNGYTFSKNKIYPIKKEALDILKYFKLSNNHSEFILENGYYTCIDFETGLKHFYKNNIENLYLLFINNGVSASCLIGNNKNDKTKKFIIKDKIIICSLIGLMLSSILLTSNNPIINTNQSYYNDFRYEFNMYTCFL